MPYYSYKKLFSFRNFSFFFLAFRKFAGGTKTAAIPRYWKSFYSTLNQLNQMLNQHLYASIRAHTNFCSRCRMGRFLYGPAQGKTRKFIPLLLIAISLQYIRN